MGQRRQLCTAAGAGRLLPARLNLRVGISSQHFISMLVLIACANLRQPCDCLAAERKQGEIIVSVLSTQLLVNLDDWPCRALQYLSCPREMATTVHGKL